MIEGAWHPETVLQHLGEQQHIQGAVVPPIFQNSLFVFETADDFAAAFDQSKPDQTHYVYSRIANPTLHVVEQKIARLEHLDRCKVFSSGMAAISAALFSCIEQGSHIVCVDTAYGPTKQLLTEYLPKFNVETTMVEGTSSDEVIGAIRPETRAIYLESPSSIIFRMQDIERIAAVAKEKSITTIMDNSYSSPIFQTPADFGINIVVHSATKYLNGHSDVVCGVLATDQERYSKLMNSEIPLFGAALPPFPAWLLLRGLRTLPIRMRAHQEAGNFVADFLDLHEQVERVFHVGLASHPQRELIVKHLTGSTGLLTFEPKCQDIDKLKRFAESLEIFQMGVSWGGFESLCVPIQMHPLGWPEARWVIRLFCGLESPQDLVMDLEQGFRHLT